MEPSEKQEIRKEMRRLRTNLSRSQRNQCHLKIFAHVRESWKVEWKVALTYLNTQTEVDTQNILRFAFDKKLRVCVPSFNSEKNIYVPCELKKPDQELESGRYGIQEPLLHDRCIISMQEIDVVFVPGLAFDRMGHRLGYGMGYFDHMCRNIRAQKIGLAYGFQILENIIPHSNDVSMDFIITEKEVISCRKP